MILHSAKPLNLLSSIHTAASRRVLSSYGFDTVRLRPKRSAMYELVSEASLMPMLDFRRTNNLSRRLQPDLQAREGANNLRTT